MWEYKQTPDPKELYHYGVPGMKWGVRRKIAKRARLAGKTYYGEKNVQKKISRATNKRTEKLIRGKSTQRIDKRINRLNNNAKQLRKLMTLQTSGLLKSDVEKGRRQAKAILTAKKAVKVASIAAGVAGAAGMGSLAGLNALRQAGLQVPQLVFTTMNGVHGVRFR